MQNEVLGVRLDSDQKEVLYEKVILLTKKSGSSLVVRPNAEIITYSQSDAEFKQILNSAAVSIPDGTGLFLASKILGVKVSGRFGGPESMFEILKLAETNNKSVYLLGSSTEVVKAAVANTKKALPKINLIGFHDGYFQNNEEVVTEINELQPDLIFVGMGFPRQEKWVSENLKKFKLGVFIMEGGSFDYLSGKTQRAPKILQQFGFEWLFRLIFQPRRIYRQLKLITFINLVLKDKFFRK